MNYRKIIHKSKANFRLLVSEIRLSSLKDGDYYLKYPIYHYSLRTDLSSTFIEEKETYGKDIAERWSRDGCGVSSLKMAVVSLKKINDSNFSLPSTSQIAEEMKSIGGYLTNVGWIHKYLINYAKNHGLKSNNFVYEDHLNICREILNNKTAISSVTLYFKGGDTVTLPNGEEKKKGKGGHLVIIKGFKWKQGKCIGFFVDDPQDLELLDEQESNEFVPIDLFLNSYSDKSIYFWN